ncbi:CLUMA_CG019171, isoform A [Clunio marinus]|uniref:CLUMA_CG019171, isoform A n=1 Tax=Clunio marinus TaxID=568069 RepID=A0A1J1J2J7_9DIPT|nr:CLUMA_CG019171, isoform A [Clunio marinus]
MLPATQIKINSVIRGGEVINEVELILKHKKFLKYHFPKCDDKHCSRPCLSVALSLDYKQLIKKEKSLRTREETCLHNSKYNKNRINQQKHLATLQDLSLCR